MDQIKEVLEKPATPTEILIDCETIAGYEVRPWSIRKGAAITPTLERVLDELKKRNLGFDDFLEISVADDGKEKLGVKNLDKLFFAVMPQIPDMVQITLGITEEQLDKLSQEDVLSIAVTILKQNMGYLKNSFALMSAVVQVVSKKIA